MSRKYCPLCEKKRDTKFFSGNCARGDGLYHVCKDCANVECAIADLKKQGHYKKHIQRHTVYLSRLYLLIGGMSVRDIARREINGS